MTSKTAAFKGSFIFAVYLVVFWGFYRLLFQLPESVEEIVIKPIVWLVPLLFLIKKEGRGISSLGLTFKNLFPSIYYALGLGAFFVMEAVIINIIKYKGNLTLSANIGELPFVSSLGLSFVTAFTEEISFRGYVFDRAWNYLKNELLANIMTSFLWALIHVPVTFFVWKLDIQAAAIYLFLTTLFGIGSAFIYARTKNILAPILLHVLWQWPIILFR